MSQYVIPSMLQSNHDSLNDSADEPKMILIAGDASDRKFYRLEHGLKPAICMTFPKWEGGYGGDPISWLGMQKALREMNVPVPEVLHVDPDNNCIWTEDFGDVFLNDGLGDRVMDASDPACRTVVKNYKLALDLLIQAQYPDKILDYPARHLAFDAEKLMYEMRFFVKNFLVGFLKLEPTQLKMDEIETDMERLCMRLGSSERVLCHRDYHMRNVMIVGDTVKWIDFQDARMGPHTYDVVSLVRDSYVKMSLATREEFYNYYFDKVNLARTKYKLNPLLKSEYTTEHLEMGLQRNVKALGSFGYLATLKGKPGYLKYCENTLATLTDKSAFDHATYKISDRYPALASLLLSLSQGKLSGHLREAIGFALHHN